MNQFLQDYALIIITVLVIAIFCLMGLMIFILYRLLVSKKDTPNLNMIPQKDNIQSTPLEIKKHEQIVEKHYCIHHLESPSVGSCLICEEVFCEDCLVDHESMHFCKEHFRTFASYKWKQITDVMTTPHTPEDGLYIYNFKRELWLNKNIPTFVMTHYKINIENDYIESFIQLNVREEDVEKLTNEIKKFKALN